MRDRQRADARVAVVAEREGGVVDVADAGGFCGGDDGAVLLEAEGVVEAVGGDEEELVDAGEGGR